MKRYRAVHQFHSGSAYGDAVTNQMIALRRELRDLGYESEIFVHRLANEYSNDFRAINLFEGADDEMLLFHHSMGSDCFDEVLDRAHDVVTIYHNVTPHEFFRDEGTRAWAMRGRDQLQVLGRRSTCGVADSNFNRREMLAAGFTRVDVMPVRTAFTATNLPLDIPAGSDWIFVGRVVDNKCQHEIVRAFAKFSDAYRPSARLWLVGDLGDTSYVGAVRAEIVRNRLSDRVVLTGKLTNAELDAVYAQAGVFVSLSEHEGFGVPLLEAMSADLPVIAYAAAAVPETLGGAGLLVRTKEPRVVAALAETVLANDELRRRIIAGQRERLRQICDFDVRGALSRIIDRARGVQRPLSVQIQGPFETSYSLALLNRSLALELAKRDDFDVSIHATEGPGDYVPRAEDLARHPVANELYKRAADHPHPDIVIRQMWPPRLNDSPGGLTFSYFGWEESRLSKEMVDNFNRNATGIGVMSQFVETVLRDSGVTVPIAVVGVGVDPHDPTAQPNEPELADLRSFRFLNIGSAFPRKAVDTLIAAYFAAFDGSDDVTLILKTFPNVHNEVGRLLDLARAGHPNPPDVRWIDRDLPDRDVRALYNIASCYVHPARGEGFGLPVAEAMLADVPVISVEYSGLADFVSDETAWPIEFRVEPAASHVTVPGSNWAEPDLVDLRDKMRSMASESDRASVRTRTAAARRLIETKYSWAAVARRWADFILRTELTATTSDVAMVSSWNARCGIAEYTRFLVDHGRGMFYSSIFANRDAEVLDLSIEDAVSRCWTHRWNPDLSHLRKALEGSTADVVHFQFNFGFFEINHLARLLEHERTRRGVVVTLHRTKDLEDETDGLISLRSIASTLRLVDRIIVHQPDDAHRLANMNVRDNVVVIPHGTPRPPAAEPTAVRDALGLGDRPLVGTFGFLLPHKGIMSLIDAVDRLRDLVPDVTLLALCATYPISTSEEYEKFVREQIAHRHLEDNVLLVSDFLPAEVARTTLRAADVIALPYQATEESASGAMRFVLSVERPVIATDLPIFDDAADAFFRVPPGDDRQLTDAIRRFLEQEPLRRRWAQRAGSYSRKTDWSRIGFEHAAVYAQARASHLRRTEL